MKHRVKRITFAIKRLQNLADKYAERIPTLDEKRRERLQTIVEVSEWLEQAGGWYLLALASKGTEGEMEQNEWVIDELNIIMPDAVSLLDQFKQSMSDTIDRVADNYDHPAANDLAYLLLADTICDEIFDFWIKNKGK